MTPTAYVPTELELLRHQLAQEQTVSLNALPMLEEALAELAEAKRVIDEIYAGKHGCIPHPGDFYKAGIWDIRPGHAERLMSFEDYERLQANQLPF